MNALRLLAAAALVLATMPMVSGTSFTVSASGFTWSPASQTIAAGDSVTFSFATGGHTWFNDGGVMSSCSSTCAKTYAAPGTYPYYCSLHSPIDRTSGMVGSIQVGATPTAVSISPPGTISGVATITGAASDPGAALSKVEVRLGNGPVVLATISGTAWSANFDTTTMANGVYAVTAKVFAASGASARASSSATVSNVAFVDVVVTNLVGGNGQTTTAPITVSFRNAGNTASGTFKIALEYQYKDTWRPIQTLNIGSIPAFMSGQASIQWNAGGNLVGQFPIRAVADPLGLVAESNEGNNLRLSSASFVNGAVAGQDVRDPVLPG